MLTNIYFYSTRTHFKVLSHDTTFRSISKWFYIYDTGNKTNGEEFTQFDRSQFWLSSLGPFVLLIHFSKCLWSICMKHLWKVTFNLHGCIWLFFFSRISHCLKVWSHDKIFHLILYLLLILLEIIHGSFVVSITCRPSFSWPTPCICTKISVFTLLKSSSFLCSSIWGKRIYIICWYCWNCWPLLL
jgi:hypothetical protein